MKLIIGLGNPGEQYASTRHNLGFIILDQFLKDFQPVDNTFWTQEKKLKNETALLDWQSKDGEKTERVILAKPQTYMNNSGMGVSLLASYYKVKPEDIWIVHDDVDLPLGSMKIRFGGASAGHNGVQSVIDQLGTDAFWRFRMGIGEVRHAARPVETNGVEKMIARTKLRNKSMEEFVLGTFTTREQSEVKKLIKYGSDALQTALEKGMDTAMNRFNTK